MPPRKRLGQLLTELGVLDEHQLQSALGHQKQWGGKLGTILVQKGFCKESQIVAALAKHLGMPMVTLTTTKIDPRAVKFVSKQVAEKLQVFPYEVSGAGRTEVVTIAMSDPTDLAAVDQLAFHTGKRIKPMLAAESEILAAVAQHYGGGEEKKVPGAKPAQPAPTAAADSPASSPPARVARPPDPREANARASFSPSPPERAPVQPPPQPAKPAAAANLPEPGDEGEEPMHGLEPIAAHTQVEPVEGAQEIDAQGAPADPVEGFAAAGVPHEGADQIWGFAGQQKSAPGEGGGWDAEAPQQQWTDPALAEPDAAWAADPASEPAPWTDPLAASAWPAAEAAVVEEAQGAAGDGSSPAQAADETVVTPAGGEGWPQPQAADAPDEWAAASEDPLAAAGPAVSASKDGTASTPAIDSEAASQQSASPDWSGAGSGSSGETLSETASAVTAEWGALPADDGARPQGGQAPAASFEVEEDFDIDQELGGELDDFAPPPDAANDATAPAADSPPSEDASAALEGGDGAASPAGMESAPSQTNESGWMPGAHLSLSADDEGTLASVGVDPADGLAALRALAALVRVLHRRQILDPDELAAELRDSRAHEQQMPAPDEYAGEQRPAHPQDLEGSSPAQQGPADT